MNPVMRSKPISTMDETGRSMAHRIWCPGCDSLHMPRSLIAGQEPVNGPHWDWDGNETAPTFAPSLLVHWTSGPEHTQHVCHSFIRNGKWEFLSDCTHELAGQTVPMVPLPDWLVE